MLTTKTNKQIVQKFLKLIISGRFDEAYKKYVNMTGKHHNVHFNAGFQNLKKAMEANHLQYPIKKFTIKDILSEQDLVVAHSHLLLKPQETEMVTFHQFRIKNKKIIEMWDCGQVIPVDCPNTDGPF